MGFTSHTIRICNRNCSGFFGFLYILHKNIHLTNISIGPIIESFVTYIHSSVTTGSFVGKKCQISSFIHTIITALIKTSIRTIIKIFYRNHGIYVCQ